jgi:tRNA-2-methylthio-N6-dimethylallyladenosine synthase
MMDRTYTKEEFLGLTDKIRAKIPDITLTTDIIVGFPTETEEEFEDTLQVVAKVEFDSAFTFKYSQRQGTIASKKCPDDVPDTVKTQRIVRLNEAQREITLKKNQTHIGQVLEILIEPTPADKPSPHGVGRTDGNKLVILSQNGHKTGEMIQDRITGATPHTLRGNPIAFPSHSC